MGGRASLAALLSLAACLTVERSIPDPPHVSRPVDVNPVSSPDLGPRPATQAVQQPALPVEPLAPQQEHAPERVTYPPPAIDQNLPTIPDDTVIHVLDDVRSTFLSCVRRARRVDPTLGVITIRVVVEVNADGSVESADTELDDHKLATCILNVARHLKFPPPNVRALARIAFVAS